MSRIATSKAARTKRNPATIYQSKNLFIRSLTTRLRACVKDCVKSAGAVTPATARELEGLMSILRKTPVSARRTK